MFKERQTCIWVLFFGSKGGRLKHGLICIGYEGAVSIEHEDSLMSVEEGFKKGTDLLKNVLIKQKVGDMWWA